jgi:RsiW-degrading membrane proteinase PrsW (M82 family)
MLILVVSIAPALALALYFYHKDKYEKEPLSLLGKAFFNGVTVTVFIVIVEFWLLIYIRPIGNTLIKIFLESFLVAGLIEEGAKFLVFRRLIYDNKEFNEPYDGIIYAVMISLGFATLENLFYVLNGAFKWGILGTLGVGALRAILSVPAHAFFGVIMGYYLGLAKFCQDDKTRHGLMVRALVYPVIAHGLFDFFIFSQTIIGVFYLFALFILCWSFSLKAIKTQVEKSQFKDSMKNEK